MKKCQSCRETFEPLNWWQKFCSNACRLRNHRTKKRALGYSNVVEPLKPEHRERRG